MVILRGDFGISFSIGYVWGGSGVDHPRISTELSETVSAIALRPEGDIDVTPPQKNEPAAP